MKRWIEQYLEQRVVIISEYFIKLKNYEEFYEISNLGNIKSLHKKSKNKILKPSIRKTNGYCEVCLWNKEKQNVLKVHRLVLESFLGINLDKPHVNHINGIKTDNRLENLEWCTPKENAIHSFKNGLNRGIKGEENSNSKLKLKDVYFIRENKNKYTKKYLAEKFGVTTTLIYLVINKKCWKDF